MRVRVQVTVWRFSRLDHDWLSRTGCACSSNRTGTSLQTNQTGWRTGSIKIGGGKEKQTELESRHVWRCLSCLQFVSSVQDFCQGPGDKLCFNTTPLTFCPCPIKKSELWLQRPRYFTAAITVHRRGVTSGGGVLS